MSAVLSRRCLKIQAQLNQAYLTVTCVALRIQHRGSPCTLHVQPQARQGAGRCCWVQTTVWVQLLMNKGGGRLVSEGVLVAPIVVLKPWWLCRVGRQQAPAALTCRQLLRPPELQPPSGSWHMLCRQGGSVRMLENKSWQFLFSCHVLLCPWLGDQRQNHTLLLGCSFSALPSWSFYPASPVIKPLWWA